MVITFLALVCYEIRYLKTPKVTHYAFLSDLCSQFPFSLVGESSEFSLTEQNPKSQKSDLLNSDFMAYKVHKL